MEDSKNIEENSSKDVSPTTPVDPPICSEPTSTTVVGEKVDATAPSAIDENVPRTMSAVINEKVEPADPSVIDETMHANHQQITVLEDLASPVLEDVPDGPPLDEVKSVPLESANGLGDTNKGIIVGSSAAHSIPAPHSVNTSKEEQDYMPRQLDNDNFVSNAKSQVKIANVVTGETRKTEKRPHLLLNELSHGQAEVESMQSKTQEIADSLHALDKSKGEPENRPHGLEDGNSVSVSEAWANNVNTGPGEERKADSMPHSSSSELNHCKVEVGRVQDKTIEPADSSQHINKVTVKRGLVDTAAPFESVREAVTKFGGIVDWKAHKVQTLERHNHVQFELEKVQEEIPKFKKQSEAAEEAKSQVLMELDSTKRLIEELKLSLERAQTEEAQAKQDSDLARLRVQEMEQGIDDEASVAAKVQLEVAKARYAAAIAELKSTKEELAALQREYASIVNERDIAVQKAEEAVCASKEIEKTVEDLTLELITAKESLESAHAAHLEAEEHRIGAALAREQDVMTWEKELKQAEEELQRLNEQLLLAKDIKTKLDTASTLLLSLKAELAAYMEAKLNQESESIEEEKQTDDAQETKETQPSMQAALASTRKELQEVKTNIEKAKDEVNCLRVAASSLRAELEKEKAGLVSMRQREGMASIAVSSLDAEVNRIKEEIKHVRVKEKESREKMVELPKLLQQAAQEADQAKSAKHLAQEEQRKVKEELGQVNASATTTESRLHAALKEIEAARASESLALAAIKALEESEEATSIGGEDSPSGVTLPLDEYYNLSKQAHEAEELANERVTAAIAQIQVAKESEKRSLERLEEANRKMAQRKEALRIAKEKAEKAKVGKLGVEQELRKWRAENEKLRKARDAAQGGANPSKNPPKSFEESRGEKSFSREESSAVFVHPTPNPKLYMPASDSDNVLPEKKTRKTKKSFLPKLSTFLARKNDS